MSRQSSTRQIAFTGMLFALALAFSYLESLVTPLFGLPPGIKIGLANIVVMYALLANSRYQALLLVVLKAGFAMLTRGPTAGMLSLAGGLAAVLVMTLLLLPKMPASLWLLSVSGAIAHNMGQLLVVRFLMGAFSLYYMPLLLAAGLAMGSLCAVLLRSLLPAIKKAQGISRDESSQKNN